MERARPRRWQPPRLCLSSGKGGVGKTSLAVNLAFALADQGIRVLLVDGDLGLANVDVLLGLSVTATIREVLAHDLDPRAALVQVTPGLAVLPAGSGVAELASLPPEDQAHLGRLLEGLGRDFQVVLVDTAAGLGPSVLWFNAWAHHNIVVVTPDPTSLTDAYALIKVLSRAHRRRRFLILTNQVEHEAEGQRTFATLSQVAARFLEVELDYLGSIPADPAVQQGVREQVPFVQAAPKSAAGRALASVGAHVLSAIGLWHPIVAEDREETGS
ncbi:MAG: MinD/ParA family protein [Desulfobaccales bacterium]